MTAAFIQATVGATRPRRAAAAAARFRSNVVCTPQLGDPATPTMPRTERPLAR